MKKICEIRGARALLCAAAALASMAIAPAAGAAGSTIYKWVDAKGVLHYSDKPARSEDGAKSEELFDGSPIEGQNVGAARALAAGEVAREQGKRQAADAQKAQQEEQAQRAAQEKACQSAKEAARVLEAGGRVSTVKENGEKEYLDEAQIQARSAEAKRVADEACAPPKPKAPVAAAPAASAAK